MTKVYFLRHGESVSNLITQFAGSLDMPLTEKGKAQASATADYLMDIPFTAVYASDLSRAYETGQVIAQLHGLVAVPTPHLRELNAGLWQGQKHAELPALFPDSFPVFQRQIGLAVAPEGEAVAHLRERARAYVEAIVHAHPGEHIGIVTHAIVIRAMESVWADTPLERMHTIPWVGNASVTIVDYDEDMRPCVVERDIHQHLADLHTELPKTV